MFTTKAAEISFQESYAKMYKRKIYNWEPVYDEVLYACGQTWYEVGDWVSIEINSAESVTGNPEIIEVGPLVEVPIFDENDDGEGRYLF